IVPLVGVAGGSVAPSTTSLQLGAVFGGAQVDPLTDTITFTGRHNLQSGDSVYYFPATPDPNDPTTFVAADAVGGLLPRKLYTVNRIDDFTIKLRDPLAPAPLPVSINAGGGTVTVNGSNQGVISASNNFANNEPVTYIAPSGKDFSSGLVNVKTTDGGAKPVTVSGVLQYNDPSLNTIWLGSGTPDANGDFPIGHGFHEGDAVIYTAHGLPIGGLQSGHTYFVHVVDDYTINLAESFCEAVGCAAGPGGNPPGVAQDFITLNPSLPPQAVVHTLVPAHNAQLTGLTSGQVYFVANRTPSSFQLANAPGPVATGGTPIFFSNGGHTGGPHVFDVQGVDLTGTGIGLQNLVFDIHPGSSPSVTEKFDGIGGTAALAGAPTGDQTATASSSGSSGGVINVAKAHADASVHPMMTNTINAGAVIRRDHIAITPGNFGRVAGTANNGGGGLVSIGSADTSATSFVETTITIAQGAQLIATFEVTVDAGGAIISHVEAAGGGGGLGAGGHSNATSSQKYTTETLVDGTITAGTDVLVQSDTSINATATASSLGGGLGVGASASATAIVDSTSLTGTQIQPDARVTGNRVQIAALVPSAFIHTHADSEADAFGASSDANAES